MTTLLMAVMYAWVAGLDLFTATYGDDPAVAETIIGYDRDTHRVSQLRIAEQCYTVWTWTPTENAGAITHLFMVGRNMVALYHGETGYLRVEPIPASFTCTPVEKH